jgi:hypothetical protein
MVKLYKVFHSSVSIQTLAAIFDNRVMAEEYIKKKGDLIKDAERILIVDISHIPHNPIV